MIKMSIEQLKELVERLENRRDYGSMTNKVIITINKHPNGREYLEFEQPCTYPDCNSTYHRYEEGK